MCQHSFQTPSPILSERGSASALDQARFDALLNENAVLARHLAASQDRHTQAQLSQCKHIEHLEGALMRARAELLKKDTVIAQLQDQLQASVTAADLVICQTGCVSHDAYWRVKDYCKRTGKRCIFVDTPSHSAMKKALETVTQDAPSS
ncbi:MAG: DUF2325 domain-containing protein [Aquabacterium sp.]|uniref:DUF2325 domain-containing protein n=1 Tax=Aquabacterium sp. TaxID=1872578 RepID=UPI00122B94C3|nr:DUF2325 domain-containing protein [Aquabacterium sp.]TAK96931.1 MAG: DUF2325 domain-containing protein [Aquabacterium sp.]